MVALGSLAVGLVINRFSSRPLPIVYQMPEPYSYDRRTYIDASTHPVTVWYVDYNGYLVRVQPMS